MRYELADHEWVAIKPMLPNKPHGVRRVNDRRVLNGIFWVLRSGGPLERFAGSFWPLHDLLQPFRPLAAGWCLGPHHRRTFCSPRCRCPDDRHPLSVCVSYRARNQVERFFNRIKQCRRVATRYDRLSANYLAFVQLASIRLWLGFYESASQPLGINCLCSTDPTQDQPALN
nr:transposase [Bradyrhizobium cajani]